MSRSTLQDELDSALRSLRRVQTEVDRLSNDAAPQDPAATGEESGIEGALVALTAGMPGLCVLLDAETEAVITASAAYAQRCGNAQAALPGGVSDTDAARLARSLGTARDSGGRDAVADLAVALPSGHGTSWWRVTHVPIKVDGRVRYIVRHLDETEPENRIANDARPEVGTWWVGADGTVQISKEFAAILECTAGAEPLEAFAARFGAGAETDFLDMVRATLASGDPLHREEGVALDGGRTRTLMLSGMLVRDGAGTPVGISGVCRDVSRSLAALDELAESRRETQTLADAVPVKVWVADVAGRTKRINQRLVDFLGLTEPSAHRHWSSHIHPADVAGYEAMWAEGKRGRCEMEIEARLRRRDGAYRWHKLRIIPVFDAEGAIAGWYGAGVDVNELKIVEARTRELSERLTVTLGSIDDGLATYDRNWRCTFINDHGAKLIGRDASTFIGRVVWDEFPHTIGSRMHDEMQQAMADGERRRLEAYEIAAGRWFDVTIYPFGDGITLMFRDVTVGQRRDERLQILETAVSQVGDAVMIAEVSPDSETVGVIYVNDAYEELTGFSPAEVLGRVPSFLDKESGTVAPETVSSLRAAMANGKSLRTELYQVTRDGRTVWVDVFLTPIDLSDDSRTVWVAVLRDQTERKSHNALVEWQASMLDRAHDAIVVCNLDGSITYWNKRAEKLYGWKAGEAIGKPMAALIGASATEFDDALATIQNSGYWAGRLKQKSRDGQVIQVGSNWSLIPPTDQHEHSILTINVDVTQRILLDEELTRMQRLEAVGKMTGGIAHDFNNLLTIILGSADMIALRAGDSPDLKSLAGMSRSAAERGRDLVRRLLTFAKRQQLEPVPTDINGALDHLRPMLVKAVQANVELELELQSDIWLAEIDPGHLEDALINLALNAGAAMQPDGGTIIIETRNVVLDEAYTERQVDVNPGEYVLIRVSDTGEGMDEEVQRRVFEPFFTTKEGKGSGLGLSMVYGFIKQSGGHIRIYSEVGAGTTVSLWLPRSTSVVATDDTSDIVEDAPMGTETILLVEDDASVRQSTSSMLQSLGYKVVEATRGDQALKVLDERSDIDLVFTDVIMPGPLSGLRLGQHLAERWPGIRVLFTSGYSRAALLRQSPDAADINLLSKPYRVVDLAVTIREVIDGPHPDGRPAQ
ncbi:PAS domain S-box protein [Acuticoccus kandeliae]|uniref:PAS domain S-box protein n=1 Tax=Acuticoccus kandeliae TaxID=2073160 RepID=UPI001473CCCA|nr:PAS domain S-box protein [Acuticoccus kandeliae]